MTITIVLNGDIETCCTYTLASEVPEMVGSWIPEDHTLRILDVEQNDPWEPDSLAKTAIQYFADEAYPLVYLDETLCAFGALPSKKSLLAYLAGESEYELSDKDIFNAAVAMKKITDT